MNIKKSLLGLTIVLPLFIQGQIQEKLSFLESRYTPVEIGFQKMVNDTIDLPIVDDFSSPTLKPRSDYWADQKVYINTQLADSLISIGIATFDGLDEFGAPYLKNSNTSDTFNDVLTSHYINLSGESNVFLSFIYQPQGLGESPESDDSLVVDFWSVDDSLWIRQWSVEGSGIHRFKSVILEVADSLERDGFRFRIGTYGARSGDFDHWHIDYVQFDADRNINDTIIEDPALNRPPPTLIKNYTSLPYFHMAMTDFKDSIEFGYRRNGPVPVGGWALNLGQYIISSNGSVITSRTAVPVIANTLHDIDLKFKTPLNAMTLPAIDTFTLNIKSWFDGTAAGIRRNDTLFFDQVFSNYYAYDDGSAERAYGIENVTGAQMALRFQAKSADTLKGIYMHFAHAGNDATDNTFQIYIWEDNNGEPGNIIYKSDSVYTPQYAWERNQFIPYELDNGGVYISGSVFIGVRQKTNRGLNFGYDIRTVGPDLFYGDSQNWYQSLFTGALMFRPYYRSSAYDLNVSENNTVTPWTVFPNPSSNVLFVQNSSNEKPHKIEIFDLTGRLVKQTHNENSIEVSDIPNGLYLVHIFAAENKSPFVTRVIVQ